MHNETYLCMTVDDSMVPQGMRGRCHHGKAIYQNHIDALAIEQQLLFHFHGCGSLELM